MRRKNIFNTAQLHVENFDLKNIILRKPEIVDNFCRETIKDVDGKEMVRIVDPVHMLLNQERLTNSLGNSAAQAFIDSFRHQNNDPFAELRSKCSDADLMTMVKYRHLQAPCEILSWCKYMKENIDVFNSEVQKLIEAKQSQVSQQVQQTQSTESTKTE